MKKIIALILVLVLAVSLVACNNQPAQPTQGNDPKPTQGNDPQPTNPPATQEPVEEITLRLAHWGLGTEEEYNLERQMIDKYMELNPHVKIVIADDITGDWNAALATAAAGQTLPDVFLIANVPTAVANEWTLDLTPYTEADEDWSKLPASMVDSVKYGSGIHAIPLAMHINGLYINVDLFEEMNVDPLESGYSMEEFEEAVEAMTDLPNGKIALADYNIYEWYASVLNSELGFFTYADGKVSLNDPAFIEAVKYCNDIYTNKYSFNALNDDEKAVFGVGSDWDAWCNGALAMKMDATWNANFFGNDLPYNIKFVTLPEGRSVIIPDYICVAKSTAHPQEAYDFAKWMAHSKEGILTRLDLDEADDSVSFASIPLILDEEISERFFANYPMEGVQEVYEDFMDTAIVEAFKFAPGYTNARWEGLTGITVGDIANANMATVIDACVRGVLNIDDYAEQLNTMANNFLQEVQAVIDKVVK